jgi:uncharacterized damage-inducible protein DinB
MQKRWMSAVAVAAVCSVAVAQMSMPMPAQPAGPPPVAGPAGEVQRGYAGQKGNILKAAEEMPAADYTSMPTPGVRTYARVVNHITEAQTASCGAVNGNTNLPKVPADTADKAVIVAALKASFDECDKAFASATDANLLEMITMGQRKRSRVGILWGVVSHDNEQYATLALYLRMKGLKPPSMEM